MTEVTTHTTDVAPGRFLALLDRGVPLSHESVRPSSLTARALDEQHHRVVVRGPQRDA